MFLCFAVVLFVFTLNY